MSICPPRPDTNRRCFAPCPVGSFCECEGVVVGHIFGIDVLDNPTVPVGVMVTTLPAKAMEARRATTGTGVVHDSAAPKGFAQDQAAKASPEGGR